MHETPDWEEIYGIDPNAVEHFESIEASLATFEKCRYIKRQWILIGVLDGGQGKQFPFLLRIVDDEMYWLYMEPTLSDPRSKVTMFTDYEEAKKVRSAAMEKYPEFKIYPKSVRVE